MEIKELPTRPNLAQYKKQAKALVKAFGSQAAGAATRIRRYHPRFRKLPESRLLAAPFALADAQLTIAREHGFESWPKFAKHIQALCREKSPVSRFEFAVEAVVAGELTMLDRLLREDPELPRARSTREHGATLLHYVAANGIEDYRQKTPKNAALIAESLIAAGADVDATLLDGCSTTLGLAASSIHPERTGVQVELIETLLDHGAAIDGLVAGAEPLMWAITNGRGAAAETLARRGARVDNVVAAAALGRLDLVEGYLTADSRAQTTGDGGKIWGVPKDAGGRNEQAFIQACLYGRTDVADFLLQKGVDAASGAVTGQTGMHFAAHGGHLDTVKLLIQRKAPLEARNMFGGTVLGQAVWSAIHEPRPDHFAIITALLDAGARIEAAGYPTGKEDVDNVLRRYRAG